MSIILETRLTKEEIFTLYANQIYLGQQTGVSIYGVGEASNVYFGKDVSQLTLPEAALIAGIIRSPNRYNPYKNPEKVTERRNQVLDSMLEAGAISAQDKPNKREARRLELHKYYQRQRFAGNAVFFAVCRRGSCRKSSATPKPCSICAFTRRSIPICRSIAYEIVNKRLEKLDKYFPKKAKGNLKPRSSPFVRKPAKSSRWSAGAIFSENQFNRATDAQRQPGSVFKPFVYAAAINSAYEPNSQSFHRRDDV